MRKDFTRTKKHKKHQKHKNITRQKHKNANKRTKIKNALKNILGEKSHLFVYLRFCVYEEKDLFIGNVSPTKLVKVLSALYEQKVVCYNPVKKLYYLNDSGATKLVKVCTPIHAFTSLVAPVKKLNCLNEIG